MHRKDCSLVHWDFIHTLKIITRTLSEVVNREGLCGTSACMTGLFACSLGISSNRLPHVVRLFACSLGISSNLVCLYAGISSTLWRSSRALYAKW